MADEIPQSSSPSDDNTTLVWVPTIAAADGIPTVAEFNAGTKFTYSLTPDGWSPTQSQATVTDARYTLGQALERPGRKTKSLTIKYVVDDAGDDNVAADLFIEGTTGNIVARRGIDNGTAGVAAQLVSVWPVVAGEQIEDPAVENGVDTISQTLFVTGVVKTRVPLAAGA